MNFEPIDVKKSISVSGSIFSMTTIVCQMEKVDVTKIEWKSSSPPLIVERYTANISQLP